MTKTSRLMIAFAAVLLASVYVLPIWKISLLAPQYPEGIGMLIRVDTITGIKENDLNNINGLNHYIGMKSIEPEKIPVLDIMPVVVAILIVTGLFAALYGRRWAAWAWVVALAAAGAMGMVEFYRWSFDYGHNLDPNAIIKIPGMTYQPPLIGSKVLLNFTAASWPAAGGWAAGLAFIIGLVAVLMSYRRKRSPLAVVAVAVALMSFLPSASGAQKAELKPVAVIVSPSGAVRSISEGLRTVKSGGRLIIKPGRYREHGLWAERPVTIVGEGFPVIDGEGKGELLLITGNDVTVKGMRFTGTGVSHVEDRAAIRATGVTGCLIADNRIDNALYGIHLAKTTGCRVERNILSATGVTESTSGNGIHLWSSSEAVIADNVVTRYRDGIYFEFVHDTRVMRNTSEKNLRYGLHFMYSDDCTYTANIFRNNGAGVAVMYTNRVHMTLNRFENNWGSAAYGLLLKEIADSRLDRNVFSRNTIGLMADGANRVQATGNTFADNGWAMKVEGSTLDGRFTGNVFTGNTFDVTTNSRRPSSVFEGNFWDEYAGYDIDRDGTGDIPHAPVRLFAVIVERNPQAMLLLRSALVALLDAAERAMPALTPVLFVDNKPLMRRPG